MMTFRLSCLFLLWLLASLKRLLDRLYFVPMFLKLFASANLSFSFLEICLVVPDISLGGGVSCPVSRIGTSIFLPYLFGFEVSWVFRACLIGGSVLFLRFPFSLSCPAYFHGSQSLFCFAYRE